MAETKEQKLARIEAKIKAIQAKTAALTTQVSTKVAEAKAPTAPTISTGGGGTTASKAEQIASLEKQIAETEKKIAEGQSILSKVAGAGITTGEIPAEFLKGTSFGIPEYKTTEPDLTEAKSLTEWLRQRTETYEKQAAEGAKAYEAYLKTAAEQEKTWWEKITAQPTITETREEYYEKLGIKPEEYFAERTADIAAVDKLMQEYDAGVAAKQMALVREEERLAPMEFISARMNRVEKEANIRLSLMSANIKTKLAVMEMKEGNLEQARTLVNDAVTDYTSERKWDYDLFVAFREQNQDMINELEDIYKTALDKAEDLALLYWQKEEEDMKYKMDLWTRAAEVGINLGTLNNIAGMENEEVAKLYSERVAEKAVEVPAPKTITTAQGIMEWSPTTGRWKPTGFAPVLAVSTVSLPTNLKEYYAVGGEAETGMSPWEYVQWRTSGVVAKTSSAEAQMNLSRIDQALEWLEDEEVYSGPITSAASWTRRYTGFPAVSTDQMSFETIISDIKAGEMFRIGGKVLPSQEKELLKAFLPSLSLQEKENIDRLEQLKTKLIDLYGKYFPEVESETIESTQEDIDYLKSLGY